MISFEEAKKIFAKEYKDFKIVGCNKVEGYGYIFSVEPRIYDSCFHIVSFDGKLVNLSMFDKDIDKFVEAKREKII